MAKLEYLVSLHAIDTMSSFEEVQEKLSKPILWEI